MTFNEYVKSLKDLIKENPELGKMKAVYAKDCEGNGFEEVHYTPTIGEFDENEKDFSDESFFEDNPEYEFKPNAVCIN